ncbi:MAG: insulinase family protein [Alphaproteobacteria bacterium GM7ARS4]|nr:insulinase family protein [Alphaproteobacteria bacterium GM7ARS4]
MSGFGAQQWTLHNGMDVVVIPNKRSPVIAHMVWYKIGAADEPDGKSGIAHFFEHLMFKGTKNLEPGEFSKIVARNGGRDNAFTSQDYTAYFQTIPKNMLDTVMKMEAERMHQLILTDDTVYPERDVILEERKQRVDNDPTSILDEAVDAALYPNHPYSDPIIGWEHEIQRLTTDDALAFYRQHYQPHNAILVISGDTSIEEVKTLAEKHYGAVPSVKKTPSPAIRPRSVSPPQRTEQRISLKDPRVMQEKWQRLWKMPSMNLDSERLPEEVYDLLAEVLGGGSTSFLYTRLVREQKHAVAVSAYFSHALDYDHFSIVAIPAANVSLDTLEDAISQALDDFLTTPLDTQQVKRIKNAYLAQTLFDRDSLMGPAMIMGHALVLGHTIDDVETYPRKVSNVTEKELMRAAQSLFSGEHKALTAWLEKEDKPPNTP